MGNSESQPIRNSDKRTARRDNAELFNAAIWRYRGDVLGPLPQPFEGPSGDDCESEHQRVRVCVRRRPLFPHERRAGEFDVLSRAGNDAIVVHDCRMRPDCRNLLINHHSFTFDRVFDEEATTDEVYSAEVLPLVRRAAAGSVAATVLMYGQTGSGKTFTMAGLHSRLCDDLFASLSPADEVTATLTELGVGGARDLLRGGDVCQVLADPATGTVEPLPCAEVRVDGATGLRALFEYGASLRETAATGVHDASSRSHAVFRLHVQRAGVPGGSLTLVDLAGSEQRIDADSHSSERTRESAAINASLLALKDSVASLNGGGEFRSAAGGRHPLTLLLRPSFERSSEAGRQGSGTVIIATVSPASKDTEHSLNTLRHAAAMHGQRVDGPQPGSTPTDGMPLRSGAVYTRGGDVHSEIIGEVDVTAARKRLQREEAQRASGGSFGQPPPKSEAQGMDKRRLERTAAAAARKARGAAARLLSDASPTQAALLAEARENATVGLSLNPYQEARVRSRRLARQRRETPPKPKRCGCEADECSSSPPRPAAQAAISPTTAASVPRPSTRMEKQTPPATATEEAREAGAPLQVERERDACASLHGSPIEESDAAIAELSDYEVKRLAAAARRAALDAARRASLESKRKGNAPLLRPVALTDEELDAPTAADERRQAAAARRAAVETARRERLEKKLDAKHGAQAANPLASNHADEAARLKSVLESLPPGSTSATRLGLAKQLAIHRAALAREARRKREQEERIAMEAAGESQGHPVVRALL